ncbi:YeiH family putative sulfate export transporter [Salibacterium salarium]|uniref:YeiH family putative sulfate export transporter n=1 Tax=Salibacterium salarium TaxID=284579 RepID=A0A428N4V0_9BACI|nr:YeiH family protein [Salibacterium salarium]RSL33513.1 YeiH family putative sulfate export transporter [Salibacterium salarium]
MLPEQQMQYNAEQSSSYKKEKALGLYQGMLLTFILAMLANSLANLPFFSILGVMIIAILLGMTWKASMDIPAGATAGITFSSKYLLRAGIILLGVRLNFVTIIDMGWTILVIDALIIACTLGFMLYIGKLLRVEQGLTLLIGVGTAICGAAAIVAIAPLIKGKHKEHAPLAVACIAILGTIGAIGFIITYPLLDLNNETYGILVGSTLHELAHVVAAAVPGGDVSSESAVVVKLGRVIMLVPVALIIAAFYNKKSFKKTKIQKLPIPWFIFGFLAMSVFNSIGVFSATIQELLTSSSVFLMAMGMAGLGLSINYKDFQKAGLRPAFLGIIGSIFIVILGIVLLILV